MIVAGCFISIKLRPCFKPNANEVIQMSYLSPNLMHKCLRLIFIATLVYCCIFMWIVWIAFSQDLLTPTFGPSVTFFVIDWKSSHFHSLIRGCFCFHSCRPNTLLEMCLFYCTFLSFMRISHPFRKLRSFLAYLMLTSQKLCFGQSDTKNYAYPCSYCLFTYFWLKSILNFCIKFHPLTLS